MKLSSPKILLINPPAIIDPKTKEVQSSDSYPSLGLFYLNSFLKNHGYESKILDFFFSNLNDIKKILLRENADIIGITCLTHSRLSSIKMAIQVKLLKKDTIVILGGHHATFMYEQLLQEYDIDFIVLGEGEKKLLNLVKAIEGKIPLEVVKGIAYKKNGIIVQQISSDMDYIEDLDKLPFPITEEDLEIFSNYPPLIETQYGDFNTLSNFSYVHLNAKSCIIISSRGCPFSCTFCAGHIFWGKKYRFRSPQNVVDEIEYYYKNFGFRYFKFWDLAFTLNSIRAIEICKEIVKRNILIHFYCQSRAESLTEDMVKWLKKSGCISIGIGVESGSQRILYNVKKSMKINSIIRAFSICKKHEIRAFPFLIAGNPGENDESIRKTKNLMRIINPYKIIVQKMYILPGTQIYESIKTRGLINDDIWLSNVTLPYYTCENTLKTLNKWAFELFYYSKSNFMISFLWILYKFLGLIKKPLNRIFLNFKTYSFLQKIFKTLKF